MGRKCATSMTQPRLRGSRLLQSGVVPEQKQQELTEVSQSLDPIRLFPQLEQLQQALIRCAVNCSPFVPSIPPAPIRIFTVEGCTTGNVPGEGSVPDPASAFHTQYREQERRKRVLGWRRTRKDPFEGEWEQVFSWLLANPERPQREYLPGAAASLPRTLSTITNPHPPARHAENPSSPLGNVRGAMASGSDPWPITPPVQ